MNHHHGRDGRLSAWRNGSTAVREQGPLARPPGVSNLLVWSDLSNHHDSQIIQNHLQTCGWGMGSDLFLYKYVDSSPLCVYLHCTAQIPYQAYNYARRRYLCFFISTNNHLPSIHLIFIMQPDSSMITNTQDISSIIADALQQQASQFQAIVSGLQSRIETLSIEKLESTPDKSKKKKSAKAASGSKVTPSSSAKKTASASKSVPHNSRNAPVNPYSTPPARKTSKVVSTPNQVTTPTPPPTRKRAPLQLLLDDTPKEFKQMKVINLTICRIN